MESLRQLVDKVAQDKAYREFFARQYLGLVNEDGDRFRAALERENAFYASTVSQLQLGK
jgi:tripartite-type tricarboxylate transporter receptor subunit TctC